MLTLENGVMSTNVFNECKTFSDLSPVTNGDKSNS